MSDDQAILAAKREGYVKALQDDGTFDPEMHEAFAHLAFPDPYTPREVELTWGQYRISSEGVLQFRNDGTWERSAIRAGGFTPAELVQIGDLAREYLAHRDGAKA